MATVPIFGQDVRPAPEVPCEHGVTDKDLDNIVSNVSAKYHRVLIHLGLSSNAIETLEIKHHKDPARVLFEGLVQWRNEKPRSSHCLWEDLLKAIEEGAENGMYAEEWRTELRERGIRTCEQHPEMEVFRDVKGSHLGSTASASAAELKTRSATSLRRRQVLPQQQQHHHQQQKQQQPVQKRSDKPCSSQDASSQTSANKTKTSHLNGRSSSNLLSSSTSRSSAECHSPQITTVPIGLHQKALSPVIAQDVMLELHQCLIMYMLVACRLVRHRESGIKYLNTATDCWLSTFNMSDIVGSVLSSVGTFLITLSYVMRLIMSYPIYLHTLLILMSQIGFMMLVMVIVNTTLFGTGIKDFVKFHKAVVEAVNWMKGFDMLYLQFKMAHIAYLFKLNVIKQEYKINDTYNVLRQTFKSIRKNDTLFTLEHFLFVQRQVEDKAKLSYVAFLAAVTVTAVKPASRWKLFVCFSVCGCIIILVVTYAIVMYTKHNVELSLPIISCLIFNLVTISLNIWGKRLITCQGMYYRELDIFVHYEIDRLRPLAQLF